MILQTLYQKHLEVSQLITNHCYLEYRGHAQHEWIKIILVTCQVICR